MAGLLVIGGLFLLWGAVTGRADAIVAAIVNPRGRGQPGPPSDTIGGDDPGSSEYVPIIPGQPLPQYPSPPDPNGIPLAPGWYVPQ